MNPQERNDGQRRRADENRHPTQAGRQVRRHAKKYSAKRTTLIVIAAIASVVLLALCGVAIWINGILDDMTISNHTTAPTQTLPPESSGSHGNLPSVNNSTAPPANTIPLDDVINIMLLGEDDDAGYGRGRTDAMILCTINTKTKTLKMTSFMRDLWVYIPGWGNNRLNAAYFFEGFDKFKETMLYNFGLEIDDCILVDFEVFTQVVDMLDGVEIDLSEAEADHLNGQYFYYNWTLTPGVNRLNGSQALAYSRIRMLDSDFVRINRQHKVMQSIFEAYKNESAFELVMHAQKIAPYLTVTMEKQEIFDYIFTMAPMLSDLKVETHRIPANGTWWEATTDKGWKVIEADMEENRQILQEILGS